MLITIENTSLNLPKTPGNHGNQVLAVYQDHHDMECRHNMDDDTLQRPSKFFFLRILMGSLASFYAGMEHEASHF